MQAFAHVQFRHHLALASICGIGFVAGDKTEVLMLPFRKLAKELMQLCLSCPHLASLGLQGILPQPFLRCGTPGPPHFAVWASYLMEHCLSSKPFERLDCFASLMRHARLSGSWLPCWANFHEPGSGMQLGYQDRQSMLY